MKSRKWPSLNWKNTWLPGQSRGQYVPINRIKSLRAVKTGISPECDLSFFAFLSFFGSFTTRYQHCYIISVQQNLFQFCDFFTFWSSFKFSDIFQDLKKYKKVQREEKYKKRTMLTKSSKPKSVPVISLSLRMIMWIRDPIHLSTNSNGINWDAIFSI